MGHDTNILRNRSVKPAWFIRQGVAVSPRNLASGHLSHNHSDLVDRLSDLTSIVLKYIPGDSLTEELNELVFGIMQLSSDLEKHALLEEKILIPYLGQVLKHPMP